MIAWKTHASHKPGGQSLPDLAARRAIRARRRDASATMCWAAQPRRIARFLRFERSATWGLIAVYQVEVCAP